MNRLACSRAIHATAANRMPINQPNIRYRRRPRTERGRKHARVHDVEAGRLEELAALVDGTLCVLCSSLVFVGRNLLYTYDPCACVGARQSGPKSKKLIGTIAVCLGMGMLADAPTWLGLSAMRQEHIWCAVKSCALPAGRPIASRYCACVFESSIILTSQFGTIDVPTNLP